MSELFNLSHIFSESTMVSDFINQYTQRTFLSEAVSILREQDKANFESLNTLYSALQEAESKAAENSKFADYFREYKKIVEQYIFKARELASQFAINVETFADANKDVLDVQDNANILANPAYTGVEYANLLNTEVPDIEPYKAFKKEFAFIGQLLQDLGSDVKEETKAQVIATVCNNLAKDINDGWLEKVIEKIADCDDCDKDGFARTMYNKFVKNPSKEMQVDVGLVKQSKLAIMNYTSYISVIEKATNDFCDGMQKVCDEIGSMFYRNKDHKLPIKTDVDGVEDRTYRLGDYSMNQVNIFISTKISQTNEICNLYLIALSIKMDCIIKYLQQCKDIINTACAGIDNTPNNEVDPGDPDDDNDGTPEDSDDVGIEPDEPDDIEPEEPDGIEPDDKDMADPDDTVVQDNSETELEQECYLFEANVFSKERYINYYALQEAFITEADDNAAQTKKKSLGAIVDNIIAQISNLVKKFVDSFTTKHAAEISYVERNRDRIQKAVIPKQWTINKLSIDPLLQFQVADFNEADSGLLGDKTKYIQTKYPNIIAPVEGDNASAKDMILAKLLDKQEKTYQDGDRKEGLDYITKNYKVALSNIQNAEKKLKGAQNKAKVIINKVSESSSIMDEAATMRMYFLEDDKTDTTDADRDANDKANPGTAQEASKQEAVRNYFTINSSVVTAVMNILEMGFNKHFKFLHELAKLNGAQPLQKKEDNENNTGNNQNNEQQGNNA